MVDPTHGHLARCVNENFPLGRHNLDFPKKTPAATISRVMERRSRPWRLHIEIVKISELHFRVTMTLLCASLSLSLCTWRRRSMGLGACVIRGQEFLFHCPSGLLFGSQVGPGWQSTDLKLRDRAADRIRARAHTSTSIKQPRKPPRDAILVRNVDPGGAEKHGQLRSLFRIDLDM